jgi:hypothetical protein
MEIIRKHNELGLKIHSYTTYETTKGIEFHGFTYQKHENMAHIVTFNGVDTGYIQDAFLVQVYPIILKTFNDVETLTFEKLW